MLATRTVDVEFLKQQENTRGLLKALAPKAGLETRRQAAGALRWLGLGQRRVAQALGRLAEDSETPESLREVAETSLAVHNFVARALAGQPASCVMPIHELYRLCDALARPLRKRFAGSSALAIQSVNDHLSGACRTCGHRYSGQRLTDVGAMQKLGGKLVVVGGGGQGARLMMGMCEMPGCTGMELCLNWMKPSGENGG